jgi:hypothetical protein
MCQGLGSHGKIALKPLLHLRVKELLLIYLMDLRNSDPLSDMLNVIKLERGGSKI